jgi:GH18 family chitinase
VNELKNHPGVDGVNVDYEGLQVSCAIGDNPRLDMVDFVKQLRGALPAGSYLSVDTYASSAADPSGFFDIAGINPYTDSFFVMAYDSDRSNYNHPPLNCSRYCLSPVSPLTGYFYNDTRAGTEYSNAVPASKVILGLPYYSRADCVSSWAPNQYPSGQANFNLPFTQAVTIATDPTNSSYVLHRDALDPAGQSPWSTWTSNSSPVCPMEMYWDDTTSLANKYALVNQASLRGVGIWNLNQGGGRPELWNALAASFAWKASYDVSHVPTNWVMGQSQTFPVTVTNTGNQTWPSVGFTEVDLDLHFASYAGGSAAQQYWLSSKAFSLPSNVGPGQSVTVTATWSPPGTGQIVLEAEMIKEQQFWFAQFAPTTVHVAP